MPANVYTTLANATVYTDKLQISTGANAVTYQAYATALGSAAPAGNIYNHLFLRTNWVRMIFYRTQCILHVEYPL